MAEVVGMAEGDRLRFGIVGCGAIAQIQYLPLLREMAAEFEIGGLCDVSGEVLNALGDRYGVPAGRRFRDYRALAESDVAAVVVCNSRSHAGPSIAAAEAGKHVLVEKPMCTTPEEGAAMVAAAERAGVALMVGYMKRHDPGYRWAAERVGEMADVRFAEVRHLHPDNSLHLARFDLVRGEDLPFSARAELAAEYGAAVAGMLGFGSAEELPPAISRAFFWVHNSMIHDLGNLHGVFGPPERVVGTEIWAEGNAIATTLAYAGGWRAVCTWVDLPALPAFEETLAVYGSRERVRVSFPTGFSIGMPTIVVREGADGEQPWREERSWRENPFALELRHLKACARSGGRPRTDGRDAVRDIELVRDLFLAYLRDGSEVG